MIQRMKGTVDILPQDSRRWQAVEDAARAVFDTYLYQEIRTPMFESFDLFSRSVGETSDIVSKEMYDFYDKGDRHIALRPEGTAPVVRAFVENKLYGPEHPQPLKVYYMGPMFRYERPQAGRQRQFHQLGAEVFGSTNPAVDVEVIALALDLFEELGLTKIKLHINSLGDSQARQDYRQALVDYFTPHKEALSADSQRRLEDNPLRIIDSKAPEDQELIAGAPSILDFLGEASQAHFDQVQEMLTGLGIDYTVDPSIVRGLDYYQDTIFEIIVEDESIGAQSTVCGGGRYDGLVQSLGGPEAPGVGFAIGMERLMLLLEEEEIDLVEDEGIDIYVMTLGDQANEMSLNLVQAARKAGLITERDYLGRSMKSQFKTIDKLGARIILTVGDQEVEAGTVQLKNTQTGQQATLQYEEVLADIDGMYRYHTLDQSVINEFFKGE